MSTRVNVSKSPSMLRKALWGSLFVGLMGPLTASALPAGGQHGQIDWTQSEFSGAARPDALSPDELRTYHEDHRYIRSLVRPDVATSLDYSDPRVFRFVLTRLKMAGKTPRTAPRLFDLIHQRRAADQWHPRTTESTPAFTSVRKEQHFINSSNFLTESSPYMEANALVTYPGVANYLYVDSAAWDNNGTPLGVMGYGEKFNGSIVKSVAIGDITKTSALDYEVDSYALMDSASGLRESYILRENNRKCQFDLSTLNITDPVNKTGGQCVDICLNRTWTGDCDYDLTGTPTALKIPLSGSIGISFNNPNCVFDANRIAQYQNGTVTPPGDIKVVLTDVGGGCDVDSSNALHTPMQNFWQHVTLSNGGKTLSWNLTGADAALFDSSCRQVQDELFLTMILGIPMKQGALELPPRPIVVSNDPDSQATDYQLPCISMTNSCLAEGTQVQLADGRLVPIESIQIGDKIFNPFHPGAQELTVTDISKGFETAPMVRIKDKAGRDLLMTEMHPIATVDRGMVQARKLRVGDKVQTRTGISQLVSVTREPFPGKVHNLKVGSTTEALKLGSDQTVVYANGFLVGDGQIQQKYESAERTANAKLDMRKRVNKHWRQDYVKSATR
ncbi:Hint domain-containing protein [Archangium sp.]|uniref:Hint domain-containing protein n=1 Tax=Archangium sp. TaxID=1872627 RepID=UPI002D6D2A97|nr:Hint domain-containing protein [Archangium sp.]HYO58060.1 Hint domain-containing protein [Archangium sp.]